MHFYQATDELFPRRKHTAQSIKHRTVLW